MRACVHAGACVCVCESVWLCECAWVCVNDPSHPHPCMCICMCVSMCELCVRMCVGSWQKSRYCGSNIFCYLNRISVMFSLVFLVFLRSLACLWCLIPNIKILGFNSSRKLCYMNLGGFKALSSYNTERHFLKYLFKNVCPLLAFQCAGELSGMSQIRNVTALPSRVKTKILQKKVQGELMKSFQKSMGGAGLHPALLHWESLPPRLQ